MTKVEQKYPFKLSDAPTADSFAANTHWYYMTLSNTYVTYTQGANKYSLSSTNPISYGSFWAFVETENGEFEIYNAATGLNYVLASTSPINDSDNGGNTYPVMTSKNDLDNVIKGTWHIKYTDGDEYFYLGRPGEDESYLNCRYEKLSF